MGKLYVGIDISKDRSSAKRIDEHGESRFEISFAMDGTGFAELLKAIKANSDGYGDVIAAMESTACYHINLYSFLSAKGIETIIINPLLIANYAKLSLRKTKTDKKDAGTIAQFILAHKDSVKQLAVSQDLQDIRDMARERESLCHQISAAKVEIQRILLGHVDVLVRLAEDAQEGVVGLEIDPEALPHRSPVVVHDTTVSFRGARWPREARRPRG